MSMDEMPLVTLAVREGGVAVLTLNRPEKANAFNLAMVRQWRDALDEAMSSDEIRAMVITGAGRAFCAGGDAQGLHERTGHSAAQQKDYLWREVHQIALRMEQFDKPTVAAINGSARGAGLDMALMCDFRFMATSATIAESYIHLGLVAGDGGAWYLSRLIRVDQALDLCLSGRTVGASEAEKIGLVTRVVDDAVVLDAAVTYAATLAAQPHDAVRLYKRILYQSRTMPLNAHLDAVSSHMAVLRDTDEHRLRAAALVQRGRKS